jgi:putative mRNA 3-end processing factor
VPELLTLRPEGLYCPEGDFHIDPWKGVDRALITHGHADHARSGSVHYLTATPNVPVLRARLGASLSVEGMAFGERRRIGGVTVSFHPAGHVLGSAQIRVERRGEVWVVSGDYKLEDDGVSGVFEPVRCEVFITESTFGLPVYRWSPQERVMDEIHAWWASNQREGRASVLHTYSLGKAQRLLAAINAAIGPVVVHSSVEKLLPAYEQAGVRFPDRAAAGVRPDAALASRCLVIAPPVTEDSAWLRRFGARSTAFASGWMRIRGGRRRGNYDRGFVLSDHADWPGLLSAIRATGASRVLVTHGYSAALVRHLNEQGGSATELKTRFAGEVEG